jgi:hypothetical protein
VIPAARAPLAAALLALAGCAQLQGEPDKPKQQPVPQVTEDSLRERARAQLAQGIEQYIGGDYDGAIRSLNLSLEHGMLSKLDQSRARKYIASTSPSRTASRAASPPAARNSARPSRSTPTSRSPPPRMDTPCGARSTATCARS